MAFLFNPISGDDPDDEGWEDEVHAPSCRCDTCEEERRFQGQDTPEDSADYDDDPDEVEF